MFIRKWILSFTLDNISKHFLYANYPIKLSNCETIGTKWLIYFKHIDRLYIYDIVKRSCENKCDKNLINVSSLFYIIWPCNKFIIKLM